MVMLERRGPLGASSSSGRQPLRHAALPRPGRPGGCSLEHNFTYGISTHLKPPSSYDGRVISRAPFVARPGPTYERLFVCWHPAGLFGALQQRPLLPLGWAPGHHGCGRRRGVCRARVRVRVYDCLCFDGHWRWKSRGGSGRGKPFSYTRIQCTVVGSPCPAKHARMLSVVHCALPLAICAHGRQSEAGNGSTTTGRGDVSRLQRTHYWVQVERVPQLSLFVQLLLRPFFCRRLVLYLFQLGSACVALPGRAYALSACPRKPGICASAECTLLR